MTFIDLGCMGNKTDKTDVELFSQVPACKCNEFRVWEFLGIYENAYPPRESQTIKKYVYFSSASLVPQPHSVMERSTPPSNYSIVPRREVRAPGHQFQKQPRQKPIPNPPWNELDLGPDMTKKPNFVNLMLVVFPSNHSR